MASLLDTGALGRRVQHPNHFWLVGWVSGATHLAKQMVGYQMGATQTQKLVKMAHFLGFGCQKAHILDHFVGIWAEMGNPFGQTKWLGLKWVPPKPKVGWFYPNFRVLVIGYPFGCYLEESPPPGGCRSVRKTIRSYSNQDFILSVLQCQSQLFITGPSYCGRQPALVQLCNSLLHF